MTVSLDKMEETIIHENLCQFCKKSYDKVKVKYFKTNLVTLENQIGAINLRKA